MSWLRFPPFPLVHVQDSVVRRCLQLMGRSHVSWLSIKCLCILVYLRSTKHDQNWPTFHCCSRRISRRDSLRFAKPLTSKWRRKKPLPTKPYVIAFLHLKRHSQSQSNSLYPSRLLTVSFSTSRRTLTTMHTSRFWMFKATRRYLSLSFALL